MTEHLSFVINCNISPRESKQNWGNKITICDQRTMRKKIDNEESK